MRRVVVYLLMLLLLMSFIPQRTVAAQVILPPPTQRNFDLTSELDLPHAARSMDVYRAYAYIALGRQGFDIVDISDSTKPRLIKTIAVADGVYDMEIVGEYAYSIGVVGGVPEYGRAAMLRVLDLRNPTNPREVGRYKLTTHAMGTTRLFVRGDYLYASVTELVGILSQGGGTYPVDIANPLKLRVLPAIGPAAFDIALIDHYLYVIYNRNGHIPNTFGIFDIVDILNTVAVSTIDFSRGIGSITIIDDKLYLNTSGVVHIFDVHQPKSPTELTTLSISGMLFTVSGTKVYLVSSTYVGDGTESKAMIRVRDINHIADFIDEGVVVLRDTHIHDVIVTNSSLFVLSSSDESSGRLSLLNYTGRSSLQGRVIDRKGSPLVGVSITNNWGQKATTNSDGMYTFDEIPSGTAVLTATLAQYAFTPRQQFLAIPHDGFELWFTGVPAPVQTTINPSSAAQLILQEAGGMETILEVPAAAISATTTLALTPTLSIEGGGFAGVGYAFEVSPLTLSKPLSMTLRYNDADVRSITNESSVIVRRWNGTAWQDAAQNCPSPSTYQRNLAANSLTIAVCATGQFQLSGPTNQMQLPSVVKGK